MKLSALRFQTLDHKKINKERQINLRLVLNKSNVMRLLILGGECELLSPAEPVYKGYF